MQGFVPRLRIEDMTEEEIARALGLPRYFEDLTEEEIAKASAAQAKISAIRREDGVGELIDAMCHFRHDSSPSQFMPWGNLLGDPSVTLPTYEDFLAMKTGATRGEAIAPDATPDDLIARAWDRLSDLFLSMGSWCYERYERRLGG